MKKIINLCFFAFIYISLAGCNLESYSQIKLSQLLDKQNKINSIIKVEVSKCQDDNNNPSSDLLQANETVSELFEDAKLMECKDKGLNTFALYNVPITVGDISKDKATAKGISIIKDKDDYVNFMLSEEARNYLKKSEDMDLVAYIKFTNDSNNNIKIYPHAVYVDKIPYADLTPYQKSLEIESNKTIKIELSDVSCSFVIEHGYAPLYKLEYDNKDNCSKSQSKSQKQKN
ncbi:MAG: hypothetical protein J5846_09590 [Desulfovibrio sp.]|nr:hypothetical protein [Desulfovibrio sp.]